MCSNSRVAVRKECAPGWFETSGLHAVMLQDIEPESSSCPEKLISPVRGRRQSLRRCHSHTIRTFRKHLGHYCDSTTNSGIRVLLFIHQRTETTLQAFAPSRLSCCAFHRSEIVGVSF